MDYITDNFTEGVPYVIKDAIEDMETGDLAIPFTNRSGKWMPARMANYLNFIIKGNPLGPGAIWETPKGVYVPHQTILENPGSEFKVVEQGRKNAVDIGNRLLMFLCLALGQKAVSHSDKKMREEGFLLSFNPKLCLVVPQLKMHLDDPEWITDFKWLWSCRHQKSSAFEPHIDHVFETYMEANEGCVRNESGDNVGLISLKDQNKIRTNIGKIVTLINKKFVYTKIEADTLAEAVDIFRGFNSGVTVSAIDHVTVALHARATEVATKLQVFGRGIALDWFNDGDGHPFVVLLGLMLRRFNKNTEGWLDVIENEDIKLISKHVDYITNKNNFKDFINNVVIASGYLTPDCCNITSMWVIPYLYALFIDGIMHGVPKFRLFKLLAPLFFVLAYIERKYPRNITDWISLWLSSFDSKTISSDEYVEKLEEFVDRNITIALGGLKEELFESHGKTSIQLSAIQAELVITNAPALFSEGRKVRDNLDILQKHHIIARNALRLAKHIKEEKEAGCILNRSLNFTWMAKDKNILVSNSATKEYMEHEKLIIKNKYYEDDLKTHGLKEETYQVREGEIIDEEFIENSLRRRAAEYAIKIEEVINFLKK